MKKLLVALTLCAAAQVFGQSDLAFAKKQIAQRIDIEALGSALVNFAKRIDWNQDTQAVAEKVAQQLNEQLSYIPETIFGVSTSALQNFISNARANANQQTYNTIKTTFENRLPQIYQSLKTARAFLNNADIVVEIVYSVVIPFVVQSGKLSLEINDALNKLASFLSNNKSTIVSLMAATQPYVDDLTEKTVTLYNQKDQLVRMQPVQLAQNVSSLFDANEIATQAQNIYPAVRQNIIALVTAHKAELQDIFEKLKNTDLNQLRAQLNEAKSYVEQQIQSL